jgi:hypothetical protein
MTAPPTDKTNTNRKDAHRHPCVEWDLNQRPECSSRRDGLWSNISLYQTMICWIYGRIFPVLFAIPELWFQCASNSYPENNMTGRIFNAVTRTSGLRNREFRRRYPSRWPCGTIHPQKWTLASPTSGSRSGGVFRSRLRPRSSVSVPF